MSNLSHQYARALLHRLADQIIEPEQKTALETHLAICKECCDYARNLTCMETTLRSAMHASWDRQQPTLDLDQIMHPSPVKIIWSSIFNFSHSVGRITIMAALFLGCLLLANHFGIETPISHESSPTTIPTPNEDGLYLSAYPPPTATLRITLTSQGTQVCVDGIYYVQTTEDIERIASFLGVSVEEILEYNEITTNPISPGTRLYLPQCNSAPAQTASVISNPLSITPGNESLYLDEPE